MRGEIDFDDVSFTYPDGGGEVLTHFSLHVPAGEHGRHRRRDGRGQKHAGQPRLPLL